MLTTKQHVVMFDNKNLYKGQVYEGLNYRQL